MVQFPDPRFARAREGVVGQSPPLYIYIYIYYTDVHSAINCNLFTRVSFSFTAATATAVITGRHHNYRFRQGNKEKSITLDDIGPVADPLTDTVHMVHAAATSTPYTGAAGSGNSYGYGGTSTMQPPSDGRAMTPTTFALYQKLVPPPGSSSGGGSSSGPFAPTPPRGSLSSGRAMTPRTYRLYQANMHQQGKK